MFLSGKINAIDARLYTFFAVIIAVLLALEDIIDGENDSNKIRERWKKIRLKKR